MSNSLLFSQKTTTLGVVSSIMDLKRRKTRKVQSYFRLVFVARTHQKERKDEEHTQKKQKQKQKQEDVRDHARNIRRCEKNIKDLLFLKIQKSDYYY